jgi:hypothetical protein
LIPRATIGGNPITFSLTDGAYGIDYLLPDGVLAGIGGAAVPPTPLAQIPALNRVALLLLALALAALGARLAVRRR